MHGCSNQKKISFDTRFNMSISRMEDNRSSLVSFMVLIQLDRILSMKFDFPMLIRQRHSRVIKLSLR